jgi:uncharacterized SAM-binding protein YcdF (DUF218 family)
MAVFVDPVVLTLGILIVGLGVSFIYKRVGFLIGVSGIVFLYALSTPLVSQKLLMALESGLQKPALSEIVRPGVILVLGGDLRHRALEYGGDTVGGLSLERIRYGAKLHRQTGLPIMTTGGKIGKSKKAVALVMAEALKSSFRVSVRWMEENSINTFENAKLSSEFLSAKGINAVFLVTHAWHMPRALEAFQHVGITAIPRPLGWTVPGPGFDAGDFLPNSIALGNSAFALHEWIGRFWYRIRYY